MKEMEDATNLSYYLPKVLDTTFIKTVEELENVNWDQYADDQFKTWIRFIKYPIAWDELDRICDLAQDSSKIRLYHSMGVLYIKRLCKP